MSVYCNVLCTLMGLAISDTDGWWNWGMSRWDGVKEDMKSFVLSQKRIQQLGTNWQGKSYPAYAYPGFCQWDQSLSLSFRPSLPSLPFLIFTSCYSSPFPPFPGGLEAELPVDEGPRKFVKFNIVIWCILAPNLWFSSFRKLFVSADGTRDRLPPFLYTTGATSY